MKISERKGMSKRIVAGEDIQGRLRLVSLDRSALVGNSGERVLSGHVMGNKQPSQR